MPTCVECCRHVPHLSETEGANVRLSICESCHHIADPYVEYDTTLVLLDSMLLRSQAWIHATNNRWTSFRHIVPWFLTSLLVIAYVRWCDRMGMKDMRLTRTMQFPPSPQDGYSFLCHLGKETVLASAQWFLVVVVVIVYQFAQPFQSQEQSQQQQQQFTAEPHHAGGGSGTTTRGGALPLQTLVKQSIRIFMFTYLARLPAAALMVWHYPDNIIGIVTIVYFYLTVCVVCLRVLMPSSWIL
eukprot:PhF_6_TR40551/c0_g1_i3/m.60789/K21848/ARV1; lipid intermediate transporter